MNAWVNNILWMYERMYEIAVTKLMTSSNWLRLLGLIIYY